MTLSAADLSKMSEAQLVAAAAYHIARTKPPYSASTIRYSESQLALIGTQLARVTGTSLGTGSGMSTSPQDFARKWVPYYQQRQQAAATAAAAGPAANLAAAQQKAAQTAAAAGPAANMANAIARGAGGTAPVAGATGGAVGGAGAVGGGGVGGAGGGLGAGASAADIDNRVRADYGYLAAYLDIPVVGDLLRQGAAAGWSPGDLQARLIQTDWWRKTNDAVRVWDAQVVLDPAKADRLRGEKEAEIWDEARKLGYDISVSSTQGLALQALREGLSATQLRDRIAGEMNFNGHIGGTAGTVKQQLREMSRSYVVPIDDGQLSNWTRQVVSGEADPESFRGYLREQAKSLFPSLTDALDRGITVAQYADPYAQMAAERLEIGKEKIDFMDPKWQRALIQIDPKTGGRTSLSLYDWDRMIKTDEQYGYDKTVQARKEASAFATEIGKKFGAVA